MENTKLIAGVATFALAANLALAGIAGAATSSNDTMTVNMNAGNLALETAGALTLEEDNGGLCNGGTITASVQDQDVCSAHNAIVMDDLRSSTSDVTVTVDFGNFTGASYSQTISAASYGEISPDSQANDVAFYGATNSGNFDIVTTTTLRPDGTPLTPGTPQTVWLFDKPDSTYVLFEADDEYEIFLTVPGGTPADTYTNTIAFVIQ